MGEHLTVLKKICDKNVTLMNKNLEIYRPHLKKLLSTDFSQALIIKSDEPMVTMNPTLEPN